MTPDMLRYLSLSYRCDVLGDRTVQPMSAWSDGLRAEAHAELKRINALGPPTDLAQRDFVSHQHRRALMRALENTNAS